MRLAKLTLSGFKSFADTTEFDFEHPVTGIVGPNGCGKSNVVDAIKWVLGERSSKSLRGTEMLDVIFAGSASRKPSGMASVTLSFENPVREGRHEGTKGRSDEVLAGVAPVDGVASIEADADPVVPVGEGPAGNGTLGECAEPSVLDAGAKGKRGLPIDADMVEVERRLYRDGTSKYIINGKTARLRDIRELFLDTGIGADAYSIIEQGKVDAMLLASPQERRTIFEEAAGIAKYKQRRIEAQRKLERAMVNLQETRTQLESTERRLRLVRGQAAKARKFKELDGELKAWRMALAFEQYDDLRQRLEGLTSRQSSLQVERDAAGAALVEVEQAKQTAELDRHELAAVHKRVEQDRLSAEHARQQALQRGQLGERAIEEAGRQSAIDRERLAQLTGKLSTTEAEATDQAEAVAALAEKLAEAERLLKETGEERAVVLEELADRQVKASHLRSNLNQIDRERTALLASVQGDEKRAEALREQQDRLAQRVAGLERDGEQARGAGAALAASVEGGIERARGLETEIARQDGAVARLAEGRRERAARVNGLEQELVRLESRRATLQEMVQSRAGYADTVRAVMAAKEQGAGFSGVVGPLAEVIQIEEGYGENGYLAAVEAALGPTLQALVVQSLAGLPTQGEMAGLKGRATFLPIDVVGDEDKEGGATADPCGDHSELESILGGRLTCLRRVVRSRGGEGEAGEVLGRRVSRLLDRVLARTYLVENLDVAMLLSAGPMSGTVRGVRFVTREGIVLESDGRVIAGPLGASDQAGGLLQRHRELTELTARIAALTSEVQTARVELASVDSEASQISTLAAELRGKLALEQRQLVGEQARLERSAAETSRLERERSQVAQELSQQRERLAKIDQDRSALMERAARLQRLYEEQQTVAREADEAIRAVQLRAEAGLEQVTASKVEVGRLSEQLGSSRREVGRLEIARDDLRRQVRDVTQQIDHVSARLDEHRAAITEAAAQAALAAAQVEELGVRSKEAQEAVARAEQSALELGEGVLAARQQAQTIERDWHSLEVSRRELEVKRETLEDRASEESGLDLAFEYTEYREMMAGGDVARIDLAEAVTQVETLRDQVRKLGSVNMDAIEEETTLQTQNETLVKQVADIDTARAQLEELITRLNEVSRQRFGEVFTKIQENFGGQDGMFRRLFGGGKAEVRLMPLVKEIETATGTERVVTDQTDLLESGIEVIAKPPGKEPRSISQLSGGEKTLTAVALLMSIFRSKPSCFCILDEVDAALDEGNVSRFGAVIHQFTDMSHFIVITHNKRTMQTADRLFGVTMQERGVSKRVSVKFDQVGKDGHIAHAGLNGAATHNGAAHANERPELVHTNGHAVPVNDEAKKRNGSVKAALAAMREQPAAPVEN